jgi:hypothetical protein
MSFDDYANSRVIGQNVRLDTVYANDKEGHMVDVGLWTGQTVFQNDEIAVTSGVVSYDARDGALTFHGQAISVFQDGATFTLSYVGKSRAKPSSNRFTSEGEWTFESGTGRLTGIKGGGTFTVEGAGDKWHSTGVGKAEK